MDSINLYIQDRLFACCPSFALSDCLDMMTLDGFDVRGMFKPVNHHLREKIYRECGVVDCPQNLVDLRDLMMTEWNEEFEELARNRLVMGALRYGLFRDPEKAAYDYLGAIEDKVKFYRETGNDELLVDIQNYAMLEFTLGRHPQKHFAATDDQGHARKKE